MKRSRQDRDMIHWKEGPKGVGWVNGLWLTTLNGQRIQTEGAKIHALNRVGKGKAPFILPIWRERVEFHVRHEIESAIIVPALEHGDIWIREGKLCLTWDDI